MVHGNPGHKQLTKSASQQNQAGDNRQNQADHNRVVPGRVVHIAIENTANEGP